MAEPEAADLAAAIPEARALKELPAKSVFDLSLSFPVIKIKVNFSYIISPDNL